jgi:hypothetical protein
MCYFVDRANQPNQQTFRCVVCGYEDQADHKAAVTLASRWGDRELAACRDKKEVKALLLARHDVWKRQNEQRIGDAGPPIKPEPSFLVTVQVTITAPLVSSPVIFGANTLLSAVYCAICALTLRDLRNILLRGELFCEQKGESQAMKVLVTGGAGYIGSHTVRALVDSGYEVVVLDTLELGNKGAVKQVPFWQGSITDEALLERLFAQERPEAVVHFAAYKAPGESMREPAKYFRTNVGGAVSLLEAMTRHEARWLVFSSSCSIFGTARVAGNRERAATPGERLWRNQIDGRDAAEVV